MLRNHNHQKQGPARARRTHAHIEFPAESLGQVSLFRSLADDELQDISDRIVTKRFRKNQVILHEEKTNEFMYIILEGEVKVVRFTGEGKEIIVSIHGAGEFFGELSLLDGKTTPATVTASKESLTAIISKQDFYALLYRHRKVMENLLHILCSRFRNAIQKIEILNFNNASQRMKMLFLMLAESHGKKVPEGTLLSIRLLHQDIADMVGLSRETVTRILDRWKRNGEIEVLGNKTICLKSEFESLAFSSPLYSSDLPDET
jgi:CRP/FNR family cyclic AMP-dependent transcriptional regulator